jgi:hypothetical protein
MIKNILVFNQYNTKMIKESEDFRMLEVVERK